MISVKTNAPVEYYIVYAFNDEQELIFGATEKNLPETIEKAVTGREDVISDLFGGRRTVGSFMIDFAEFKGFPAIMIENRIMLFYIKNKLLCDTCTATNIAHSKKEHKLIENGDTVLSTNKINLRNLYNYLHSAALRNSSPEHQQWFAEHFAKYKATAKVLMKQYRAEEVSKSDALAALKKMSDEFFKRTGRRV